MQSQKHFQVDHMKRITVQCTFIWSCARSSHSALIRVTNSIEISRIN